VCGVTPRDRKQSEEIRERFGIECVLDVMMMQGRLRWFEHVERKYKVDWVAACSEVLRSKENSTEMRGSAWTGRVQ
jgi:hypothetical protein